MIGSSRKVRVHAHRGPVDMRKSFDTLAGVVRTQMGADVLDGDLFLFVGRDRRRAKVLFFDGTGLCLYSKRLSKGRFAAPWERDGTMTSSELALFLEGGELLARRVEPLTREDLFLSPSAFS